MCHSAADPYINHQIGCGGNPDRIHRHNSVRDVVLSAAQTAALAPWWEVPSLIPGTQSAPQMSSCLIGPEAIWLLSTLLLFSLFNKQLSRVPPQLKDTHFWWGRPKSSPPMVSNVNLLELLLFLSPLKPLLV